MLGLLIYIYNIAFIILYMKVIEVCLNTFNNTGFKWIRDIRLLFYILLTRSVCTFAFDMGLIQSDVEGMSSLYLHLNIMTNVAMCFAYIIFATDYLSRKPHIYLITMLFMLTTAEILILDMPTLSVLMPICLSLVLISVIAAMLQCLIETENDKNGSYVAFRHLCILIILFMVAIFIYNIFVYLINPKGWFDLSYKVSFVDYIYEAVLSLYLLKWLKAINEMTRNLAIAENLKQEEGIIPDRIDNESMKLSAFCAAYKMTGRERQIMELIMSGKSNQDISEELFITIGTVKHHIHNIYTKLEIERRSQLMRMFIDFHEEVK